LYLKGALRPGITAMRRAYPQFMAAGGEALPDPVLTVIFPRSYEDLIRKYAAPHHLDPYLMTALIAQESTFQADIRSVANAWGLMQVVPATGRAYARKLRIGRFTTRRLIQPEVNIRIGMAHFADLVARFGDPALALAAYNAGSSRVTAWQAERPGLDRDEFIDDIPFPETQNYVKRILGTAEDYRVLYGSEHGGATRSAAR
jgi:soluble lytic murein transglycosylase